MKLLIIGNLPEDRQESMLRFRVMMRRGLTERGHTVLEAAPRLKIAKMAGSYHYSGLSKYIGYWDKFVLFPRQLATLVRRERPDAIHIVDHANAVYAKTCPARTLVTCHDLQQIRAALGEIPQQQLGRLGKRYQAWILHHIKRTRSFACVSASTAADLTRIAGVQEDRISVVPNALNDPFAPLPRATAQTLLSTFFRSRGVHDSAAKTSFILNVGGGQWYKNRPGILRIHGHLRAALPQPPLLIMVGKPLSAEDRQLSSTLGTLDTLIHLEDVPNGILNALYSSAEGLLFPSFQEGFGWPIAEAQACGCPVFTSDRAPMDEVAGPHAVLVPPENPGLAAEKILAAWPDRWRLAERSLPLAHRWLPSTMISAYETLYQKLSACPA